MRLHPIAALVVSACVAAACTAPSGPGPRPSGLSGGLTPSPEPRGFEQIQHLIFIVQENRSFDHYFGTFPGADGIPTGEYRLAVSQDGSPMGSMRLEIKEGHHGR